MSLKPLSLLGATTVLVAAARIAPALVSALLLGVGAVQAGTVPPSMRPEVQREPRQNDAPQTVREPSQPRSEPPGPAPGTAAPPRNDNGGGADQQRGGNNHRADGKARNGQRGTWNAGDERGGHYNYNRGQPTRGWNTGGDSHHYRPAPPRRYVPVLPYGYSRYAWRGRPYYHHGGAWYRPWGSQFAVVAAPVGLYVSYLPSYHTSFWYGNSRYFFADNTYYLYEPSRSSYVVTPSPYGETAAEEADDFDDEELYVYPAGGQSEQQQADDRYECHRWAVNQTGHDPVDAEYSPENRDEYLRAMTACLTGRGYTVR